MNAFYIHTIFFRKCFQRLLKIFWCFSQVRVRMNTAHTNWPEEQTYSACITAIERCFVKHYSKTAIRETPNSSTIMARHYFVRRIKTECQKWRFRLVQFWNWWIKDFNASDQNKHWFLINVWTDSCGWGIFNLSIYIFDLSNPFSHATTTHTNTYTKMKIEK